MITLTILCLALSATSPEPRPNTDAFFSSDAVRALPLLSRAQQQLVDVGFVSRIEPRLGVPSSFFALRMGPAAPAWANAPLTTEQIARRYLLEYAPLYRLSGLEVATLRAGAIHDAGVGAIVVSFSREVQGVPLFRDAVHLVLTQRRELVAILGSLNPFVVKDAPAAFHLLATTALEVASLDALGLTTDGALLDERADAAGWKRLSSRSNVRSARARRTFYGLVDSLEPAWELELTSTDGDAWRSVVSARDGRVLLRKHLVESAGYRVWADGNAPAPSPYGRQATPHPAATQLPDLTLSEVPTSLVMLDYGPGTRTDPWLPAGASVLSGNNADTYSDEHEPEGWNPPSGLLPDGGQLLLRDGGVPLVDRLPAASAPLVFDAEYQLDAGPDSQQAVNAAGQMAFFTVNWVHDWLAGYGFDEAAGNGQADNFGRGGLGSDPLQLFVMDFSAADNATMGTYGDGEASRMQLGNWASPGPHELLFALPDGGSVFGVRTNAGPLVYDVAGSVVAMSVDGGLFDGCDELLDVASLSGAIALAVGSRCTAREQLDRAADAGAAAVLLARSTTNYGSVVLPNVTGVTLPTMAAWGPEALDALASLDAGVPLSARLYSTAPPARPSAFDTTIVVHEFGHFLSNRLISDASGLSIPIARSLGEGWSDFLALMAVVRESDALVPSNTTWNGAYPVSVWASGGTQANGAPLPNAWFGIRRVPYSTDFTKDGLTFRHIRDGAALPAGSSPSLPNSEVHNAGEVWATMLWESFVSLMRDAQLPFAQAHPLMMRTLVASLKATPSNPDFLEARDAVLAAALAESRPAFEAMFRAFARRGAGPRAEAPTKLSPTNTPVLEDFTTTDFVKVFAAQADDSVEWCDRDGRLDAQETGVLHLTARNLGASAMSAAFTARVVPLTQGVQIVGSDLAMFPAVPPFATTEATVRVRLNSATMVQQLEFRVDVPGASATLPMLVTTLGNVDLVPSATDDFEGPLTLDRGVSWRRGNDLSGRTAVDDQFQQRAVTSTATVLWGPNSSAPGHNWVVTPGLPAGTAPLVLRFKHRWRLESGSNTFWDGAYVEVSDDGQQSWRLVTAPELSPAYNAAISTLQPSGAPSTNPEAGHVAFTGTSAGYPALVNQTIDFGTRYAGKTVHVRFVLATDVGTGYEGWDLDDFEVQGIAGTPFTQRVADRMACINRVPVALFPDGGRVAERSTVSFPLPVDPDGDTLQLTWTQTSGPTAVITGDSFVAPEVAADAEVVFSVVASDGALSAMGEARFTVVNVNRPPTVTATAPREALRAGEKFTLTASTEDADGDAVTVTWVQTRGPLCKELGGGAFEAPAVKEGARVFFVAVASDGQAEATAELDMGLNAYDSCGCSADGGASALLVFGVLVLRRRRTRTWPQPREGWQE